MGGGGEGREANGVWNGAAVAIFGEISSAARVICVDGPHLARWACVVYLRNNKLARDHFAPEATLLRGMLATSLKWYY